MRDFQNRGFIENRRRHPFSLRLLIMTAIAFILHTVVSTFVEENGIMFDDDVKMGIIVMIVFIIVFNLIRDRYVR